MFKNMIKNAIILSALTSFTFANVEVIKDDSFALKSYSGMLPCQDCKGIKTTLSFKNNKEFVLEKIYIKDDLKIATDSGTYEIEGNKIVTKNGANEINSYVLKGENLYISDPSGNIDENFKLDYLSAAFYQNYYNKFVKKDNQALSAVANFAKGKTYVGFYSDIIDRKANCSFSGEGIFEDGHLVATNGTQKVTLTLVGNDLLVSSNDNFCKEGSLNGLYTLNSDLTYVITKTSIGNIRKDMSPEDISKANPDLKVEQKDGEYIFKDAKGIKLFSFKFENGAIKNPQILTGIYKTPQGVGLDNIYRDVKKYLSVDKVWEDGKLIKVLNSDLNLVFSFDKNDLRDQNFNINSVKDSAHIKAINLVW